jgi:Cauliflower mosaic virus peptidase (A3)
MAQGSINYKVELSWSTLLTNRRTCAKNFRAVLDTGASPVVVRRGAISENTVIKLLEEPPFLIDAQRKAIIILGVVSGVATMCAHEYAVDALVASELSVDLLHGTDFIDRYVHFINARCRKVLMNSGVEVSLAGTDRSRAIRVLVAEPIAVSPKSEAVVPVRSDTRDLCLVTSI